MSWDASLCDGSSPDAEIIASWNYTHNTNVMIEHALAQIAGDHLLAHVDGAGKRTPWWLWVIRRRDDDPLPSVWLHDAPGPIGARFLHELADMLDGEFAHQWDDMNPPNGWGSRATLVELLREMVTSVPELPLWWRVSG